jgi:hypothetical protein
MIPDLSHDFTCTVWTYFNGKATYYLASIPAKTGKAIAGMMEGRKRGGWGSIPVYITIGDTRWKSSVFPESGTKSFLFLLNAKVRKAEAITDGKKIKVTITLRD